MKDPLDATPGGAVTARRTRIERLRAELAQLEREEAAQHEALRRTPEQLRAMSATALREHIADCARAHGQRETTPAWTAMRWALDALAERDGAVPRCATMLRSRS